MTRDGPGKPPRVEEASRSIVTFRVTDDERDDLQERAESRGLSLSNYIRKKLGLELYVGKRKDK